jgi:probable addiction module antidote protein
MKRERRDLPAAVPQDEWLIEQLRDPEMSVAYLNAALAEGDQAAFMLALRNVAKARGGVGMLARRAELNRVALNRTLSVRGNPELRNLTRILDASGLRFIIAAKQEAGVRRRKRATSAT